MTSKFYFSQRNACCRLINSTCSWSLSWGVLIIFLKGIKLECFFKCGWILQYFNNIPKCFFWERRFFFGQQWNFPYKSIVLWCELALNSLNVFCIIKLMEKYCILSFYCYICVNKNSRVKFANLVSLNVCAVTQPAVGQGVALRQRKNTHVLLCLWPGGHSFLPLEIHCSMKKLLLYFKSKLTLLV